MIRIIEIVEMLRKAAAHDGYRIDIPCGETADYIESLKSALAERDATISEYAAGWEKMRNGIKLMSSFAGNVRPEEGCRLVCVRAKELLAIKQPSVSKAGDDEETLHAITCTIIRVGHGCDCGKDQLSREDLK